MKKPLKGTMSRQGLFRSNLDYIVYKIFKYVNGGVIFIFSA